MSIDYDRDLMVGDITRVSGAKKRTVQNLTMAGALECRPETKHTGPGLGRKYAPAEAAIAAVLERMSKRTMNVGEFVHIAAALRTIIGGRKLESVDQAARRLKSAAKSLEKEKSWMAFIEAAHGRKGISVILDCDGDGNWSARIQRGGVKIIRSADFGQSHEFLTWRHNDAASLFGGILG